MKNRQVYFAGIFICIFLLFTSCENFMKGAETKRQLERYLAYVEAPSYTIKVNFMETSGTVRAPAGAETQKKVTDTFAIAFDPFATYAFINWKILDAATGKELHNGEYLKIDSPEKSETQCTFVKEPEEGMQLCLYPVVSSRPRVFSWYPTDMNSLKDATIQVLFDRPMDQYSIYYTKEELKELEKDTAITEFLKDGAFADGNSIVYGYKKGEQQFYKNITISKNTVSGTSLLSCFGKPVLEQDGELLRIPVDRACLPDNYSKICVCIGDGFFSTEKNMALGIDKKIKMSESKIWMYQVGIQGDSTPLIAGTITLKKENQVLQLYKWNTDKTVIENLNQLKTLMNDEKKAFRIKTDASSFAQEEISLSVVVQEPNQDGSGPSDNFKLCYTRIWDGNYNEIALKQQTTREHIINYDTVEGQQTASFGAKNIKFQDIIGEGNSFEEGVYKFWFEFTDNCNNKSYYPSENEGDFILIVDEQVTKPEITGVHRDSYNSITIMLDSDSPMDKDITKFVLFINSETHSPAISEDHFSDQRITLTPFQYNPNTTYSFQINKTDFFGNQVFSNSYRTMIQ